MPFSAAITSAVRNARRPQGLRMENYGFLSQNLSVPLNSSSSATRNARRFQDASEEETMPLNPNLNDCEDIENPFQIPSEVSKLDESCCQITVVVLMLALFIVLLVCFILQWNGVPLPWLGNNHNIFGHYFS